MHERIDVSYRCHDDLSPKNLSAQEIWLVASKLRCSVTSNDGPICANEVASQVTDITVNHQSIAIAWDFQTRLAPSIDGAIILGECAIGEDGKNGVSITINRAAVTHETRRLTTVAHELGHAVFDMPSILAGHRSFDEFRREQETARRTSDIDPEIHFAEWRANEFMGAFLVPPMALEIAINDLLLSAEIDHYSQGAGTQFDPTALDSETLDFIVSDMAYHFGVSKQLMTIRFRRYRKVAEPMTKEQFRDRNRALRARRAMAA